MNWGRSSVSAVDSRQGQQKSTAETRTAGSKLEKEQVLRFPFAIGVQTRNWNRDGVGHAVRSKL